MLTYYQGKTSPLGSYAKEGGVNFAVYSLHAEKLVLCVFDKSGHSEVARIPMFKSEGGLWSVFVESLSVGTLYGYRAYGEYAWEKGLLFNENKLLFDPYSKDAQGEFTWSERHFCHLPVGTLSESDNAIDMPKSKVVEVSKYQGVKPQHSWSKTFLYECHVKGTTVSNSKVSEKDRGKYLGLSSPYMISHFKKLGVTAVQLLPVNAFITEQFLTTKGLQNYWGYNTLSFFMPQQTYANEDVVGEFQEMVRQFHEADIEVILDVVFNHTAESGIDGPTISLKGLANQDYYRLTNEEPRSYINDTGCGNTIKADNPMTLKLILDSLRYWVEYMGVDGFRFDLATILGRYDHGFSSEHTFFQAISQDPVLSQVKLIAEPWDIGPGGYQLGGFPAPWREWNDKFRDTVRNFWRGETGVLPELAKRIHGSSDLFEYSHRGPSNSINFITSHDGYTLRDLCTYEDKHNELNGEHNRDGHSENYSHNFGVEGESKDDLINELRERNQKNMLLTLLLSKGVPMISMGTELFHTQNGNNNAYCQDNSLSWLNWNTSPDLADFIAKLISFRQQFPIFSHPFFIHEGDKRFSIDWFNEFGEAMSEQDWHGTKQELVYVLNDGHLEQSVLVVFNASRSQKEICLPASSFSKYWSLAISTGRINTSHINSHLIIVPQCSAVVLTSVKEEPSSV